MENTSPLEHTFGPKCRLAPVSPPPIVPDDGVDIAAMDGHAEGDEMPSLHAQFFYSSMIPIDDPLSSGAITGVPDTKATKGHLRPFSPGDNNALQKAWFALISDADRKAHRHMLLKSYDVTFSVLSPSAQQPTSIPCEDPSGHLASMVRHLALKHHVKHTKLRPQDLAIPGIDDQLMTPMPTCCVELHLDVANEIRATVCALVREREPAYSVDNVLQRVMTEYKRLDATTHSRKESSQSEAASQSQSTTPITSTWPMDNSISNPRQNASGSWVPRSYDSAFGEGNRSRASTLRRSAGADGRGSPRTRSRARSGSGSGSSAALPMPIPFSTIHDSSTSPPIRQPAVADGGFSGQPFVRVGSLELSSSLSPTHEHAGPRASSPAPENRRDTPETDAQKPETRMLSEREQSDKDDDALDTVVRFDDGTENDARKALSDYERRTTTIDVAVGLSRLHMVSLPVLQMKPIYWSPINDLAVVTRATWFYR